jgi:hypothetical protein
MQATLVMEAVTDQVKHWRNCSSRNLFLSKQAVLCLMTRIAYQDLYKHFKRLAKKDLLGDLTRSSYKNL